ncbi:MAG: DUF2231 domain-containing protein [Balneolaceae bacterium]|nr:DUF2231 domain-containing protein [Balneolaceae bacterium]
MNRFIKELLRGRIFGHPIHPMLVHFPTALFISSFLLDLLSIYSRELSFVHASFYCLCIGLGGGVSAVLFGAIDYLKLTDDDRLFAKASRHAGIQLLVMILFGTLTLLRWRKYPESTFPDSIEVAISGIGVLLLLVGNFIGGDLVFKDRVGIDHTPKED